MDIKFEKLSEIAQNPLPCQTTLSLQPFLYDVAQLEMSTWQRFLIDCNPVFKEREEMVCILPTQMMLEDAYSLAERQKLALIKKKKKFSKELYLSC